MKLTSNSLVHSPGFVRWVLHGDGKGPGLNRQGSLIAGRLTSLIDRAADTDTIGPLLARASDLSVNVGIARRGLFPKRGAAYFLAGAYPGLTVVGLRALLAGKFHIEGEDVVIDVSPAKEVA